jgi:hypothetical protein
MICNLKKIQFLFEKMLHISDFSFWACMKDFQVPEKISSSKQVFFPFWGAISVFLDPGFESVPEYSTECGSETL